MFDSERWSLRLGPIPDYHTQGSVCRQISGGTTTIVVRPRCRSPSSVWISFKVRRLPPPATFATLLPRPRQPAGFLRSGGAVVPQCYLGGGKGEAPIEVSSSVVSAGTDAYPSRSKTTVGSRFSKSRSERKNGPGFPGPSSRGWRCRATAPYAITRADANSRCARANA
jgi:hypothetical protein